MDKETLIQQLWAQHGHTKPLPLRAIRISGSDAQDFLQGQLTMDMRKLAANDHRLTAWCNAKGRVWCLLRIWRVGDGFAVLLPSNQEEAFLKRMRMFVLRAQVVMEPLDLEVVGWIGLQVRDQALLIEDNVTHLAFDAHHGLTLDTSQGIAMAGTNQRDISEAWKGLRLLANEPQIDVSTQEQFLPQSLGLEALDGLHFNKGCFVGQEIVARVHYRGRAPQRLCTLLNPSEDALVTKGLHVLAQAEFEQQRVVQVLEHV